MGIIESIIANYSGSPESLVLLITFVIVLVIGGHYAVHFLKWFYKEGYQNVKKNLSDPPKQDYNKMFDDHFKEKIIILLEGRLKEVKDYNKIFKDNYKDNIKIMISDLQAESNKEIMDKVFQIYEKLTELREKYAGKMATRDDIEKLSEEIKSIEIELSSLKQKVEDTK